MVEWVIGQTRNFGIQAEIVYINFSDIFAVFPNKTDASKFCKNLNIIHSNVKFSYELERNKQLSFLDINVDNSNVELKLSIYRNLTHKDYASNRTAWILENNI